MVAKPRSVSLSMHVVTAGVILIVLVASVAAFEWLDDHRRTSGAIDRDRSSDRADLPVHQPNEWAFWDQMASVFSAEPAPADLLDRPGVRFRWWFDEA